MTQPISNSVSSNLAVAPSTHEPVTERAVTDGPDRASSTAAAVGRAAVLTAIDPVRDAWDGAVDVGEAIGGLSSGLRFAEVFGRDAPVDRLRTLSADERLDLAKRGAVTLTTAFVTASAKGVIRVADIAADFAQTFADTARAEAGPEAPR